MSKIWFTSDTHFGHKNIIKYCNRPFSNVEEMNETFIANWNQVVSEKDTVYHLGDFSMGNPIQYLKRLKGRIHLVRGNHDKPKDFIGLVESFNCIKTLKCNNLYIVLCHYPLRSWDRKCHGSYHAYGHVHGTEPKFCMSYDVGVDNNSYTPINLETLIANCMKGCVNDSDF